MRTTVLVQGVLERARVNSYAVLTDLAISFKVGLLPYIRRKVRNILATAHIPSTTDPARIARLRAISQGEIAWIESLITAVIGAVMGKKVSTLETMCSGFVVINRLSIIGSTAGITSILDHC